MSAELAGNTYLPKDPDEFASWAFNQRGGLQLMADRIRRAETELAALGKAVDQARKVIERCSAYIGSMDHGDNTKSYMMCDAWLAAHPAPERAEEKER